MRLRLRTGIHALHDNHGLRCPFKTLFSKDGVEWLRSLKFGFADDAVLLSELAFMETKIAAVAVNNEKVRLLMTTLSLGYFVASLLVAEICYINRFSDHVRLSERMQPLE